MLAKTAIVAATLTFGASSPAAPLNGGLQANPQPVKEKKAKPLPRRYKLWIRIGRCEQPGKEKPGHIQWSHPGPVYGGGLGIYIGTWKAFRLKGMPASPGQASWRQQMRVANRIYDRYGGSSPWGCG